MLVQDIYLILNATLLLVGILFGLAYIRSLIKKGDAETMITLSIGTGDAESMTFQTNFNKSDSDESKSEKIKKLFSISQDRRNHNHAEWERIKAEAIKENEEKLKKAE